MSKREFEDGTGKKPGRSANQAFGQAADHASDHAFDEAFDQAFDAAFEEAFEKAAREQSFVPDGDASWKKVQQLISRKNKRRMRLKLLPYVAASFLLGAVIFGTPVVTNAFNPFAKSFVTFTDNVASIVFGAAENKTTKPLTAPPPGIGNSPSGGNYGNSNGKQTNKSFHGWAEAIEDYAAYKPSLDYVPEGYALGAVMPLLHNSNQQIKHLILPFENDNGQKYTITLLLLGENETLSSVSTLDTASIEVKVLGGKEVYWVQGKDGWSSVEFLLNDTYISIIGNASPEEILAVAEHIQ